MLSAAKIPAVQHLFQIAENNLVRNNLNMVIMGKIDLRAIDIALADVDLVENGHQ